MQSICEETYALGRETEDNRHFASDSVGKSQHIIRLMETAGNSGCFYKISSIISKSGGDFYLSL